MFYKKEESEPVQFNKNNESDLEDVVLEVDNKK